jgi:PAS domain S-box-containing protein
VDTVLFQALLESAPDAMVIVDQHGTIQLANHQVERIFGYRQEELVGQLEEVLVPERFRHGHISQRKSYTTNPVPRPMGQGRELFARRKDGSEFPVEISLGALQTEQGPLILSAIRDISTQVQAHQQIAESAKALQRLNNELELRVEERTQDLVASEKRLRALATELTLIEERERKRLAAELHDHLQQLLVLGKLRLGQVKQLAQDAPASVDMLKQVDDVLTEALTYTRTLVTELSPPVLRDQGLAAALRWLGEYMKKHDMVVTVTVPNEDGPPLPEKQAVLLFQSVRELLMNCWKHAGTGQATVTMAWEAEVLRLEVQDQGKGFEPAAAETSTVLSSRFGLFNIQERMKALGGSLEIESAPGLRTSCILTLPLAERIQKPPAEESEVVAPHA